MRRYDGSTDRFRGGPIELSRTLAAFARCDRKRFAALSQRMPETIEPVYFSAILEGLCSRYVNFSTPSEKEADELAIAATPTELFVEVIKRLHSLPNKPCGSVIVECIQLLSNRTLSDELLDIVSYYAMNDPDPESDIWKKENYYGGDPHNHGINCVRGQAARSRLSFYLMMYLV